MKILVLVVSKTVLFGLRLIGRSGTALPGLIAEKMYPSLMGIMLRKLPQGVIVVTGTNGKTTTTKILTELLESQGQRVLTNSSGSNFTRGVYSALIKRSTIFGRLDYDVGVFELDEAYSRIFAQKVRPRAVLALNVMRDQLDRYGEIDITVRHIGEAISYADMAILNADDPPVAALGSSLANPKKARYFGVAAKLRHFLPSDEELHGQAVPESPKHKTDVILTKARMASGEEQLTFAIGKDEFTGHFPLEGVHNAVNAIAAITTVLNVLPGSDPARLAMALSRIHPAFGRGEQLVVRGRSVHLALVKNPGGFNQNMRAFVKEQMRVILIMINDNYADGRDTSWLWDVDFSHLKDYNATIIVGGIRAHDMALRLQYEDISVDGIETDVSRALDMALASGKDLGDVLVFPTYTAMLETRKILEKETKIEGMW